MASTPPPLPSSSEDEFDDDEFGCFSSAPVNSACDISPSVEENDFPGVNENDNKCVDLKQNNIEEPIPCHEMSDKSDDMVSTKCKEILPKSKEESPSTEVAESHFPDVNASSLSSQDFSPAEQTEQSDVIINTSDFSETFESGILLSADAAKDSESPMEGEKVQGNENKLENEQDVEESELMTAPPTIEVNNACDSNVSSDNENSTKQDQNNVTDDMNDLPEISTLPVTTSENPKANEEAQKDDDDFGDWNHMQTFQPPNEGAGGDQDPNTADFNNEIADAGLLNSQSDESHSPIENCEEITSNTSKLQVQGEGNCISVDSELPVRAHSPDIPSEAAPIVTTSPNLQSSSGDIDDKQEDDGVSDDDFGDFADFSSHQDCNRSVSEDKNISSSSFRNDSPNQNEEADTCVSDVDKDVKNFNTDSADSEFATFDSKNDMVDDDEDWGFQSANPGGDDQGGSENWTIGGADNGNDGGDWASFNEIPAPTTASDDIDDDFDDFSSNDFQTPSQPQNDSVSSKSQPPQDSSGKVEKVISICFPETSSQQLENNGSEHNSENKGIDDLSSVVEMGLKITSTAKEETWTITKEIRNKNPVVGTWSRLKDVNSCHALDYGWNNSHCCQEVFSTLHIDTKNVLFSQKKQAVPFYTSGLGILEPIRGGPTPAEKHQPPTQPNLLDTDKSDDPKKVLDIPPVDFDWGSSGLTNPLKVFKTDNFNTGMSSLEPFSDVLQKSMEPTKELSTEAKSFLSKIPNLNFMRSNVLMFPIKD